MSKNHLDNILFGNAALQKQSNRLGYRPAILAQQTFRQQTQVFVSSLIMSRANLNPDFTVSNVDRKSLQVIALIFETSSTFQIEATPVPVAGQNPVTDCTTAQGITHMRAMIVCRVDSAVDVEQRDASPFSEFDRFCLACRDIAGCSHAYPLRCLMDHDSLSK